jgi:type IV secretory pathway VirB2 component (pilin)
MMRRLKLIILSLAAITGIAFAFVPTMAYAANPGDLSEICSDPVNKNSAVCKDFAKDPETEMPNTIRNIINVLLFIAGTIAIIMIIVSAIKFTAAHGDSGAATKARQTLIYSVVGLIIALMAFAIVNFVIGKLNEDSSGGSSAKPAATTLNGNETDFLANGYTYDSATGVCSE